MKARKGEHLLERRGGLALDGQDATPGAQLLLAGKGTTRVAASDEGLHDLGRRSVVGGWEEGPAAARGEVDRRAVAGHRPRERLAYAEEHVRVCGGLTHCRDEGADDA